MYRGVPPDHIGGFVARVVSNVAGQFTFFFLFSFILEIENSHIKYHGNNR